MGAGNVHINILYEPKKNFWEIRTIREGMSNPSYSLIISRFLIVIHIRNKSNLKQKYMSNRKSCSYVTFFAIHLHLRLPAKPFLSDENNLQSRRWTTMKKISIFVIFMSTAPSISMFIKLLSLSNKACLISLGCMVFILSFKCKIKTKQ